MLDDCKWSLESAMMRSKWKLDADQEISTIHGADEGDYWCVFSRAEFEVLEQMFGFFLVKECTVSIWNIC